MTETPTAAAQAWLTELDTALQRRDVDAAVELFEDDSYWRDFVAFTWNLKTLEGKADIRQMLEATLDHVQPSDWALSEDAMGDHATTEAWITFETAAARGYGHLRLRNGKCWTLLTTMQELKGFEEKKGTRREKSVAHEIIKGRRSWLEQKEEREARLGYEEQPYTVIIGGGQGGIGLAARLRRLGVPTLVIEKNEKPGDSWRNRYKSLHLHDPV
jgi:putative flavoprotein involved in K+ transport